MSLPDAGQITALVLAGGRGERMGGKDKGLLEWQGKRVIDSIISQLRPQVSQLMINANRHIEDYKTLGLPVITDTLKDFQGPLAGVLSGMSHANTTHILTVPCDAPVLPEQLVATLTQALAKGGEIAVAHDGERFQPVYALLPINLLSELETFLEAGNRKIMLWYKQHALVAADFSDQPDAFQNINTPADRAAMDPSA